MYLSSIQQGIQALHATTEMYNKYTGHESVQWTMLNDWAQNHKTVILLNAGYGQNIDVLNAFFEGIPRPGMTRLREVYDNYSPYPFAVFNESDEALGGAATSFGVILPAKIYNGASAMRNLNKLRRDDQRRLDFEFLSRLTVDLDDGIGPVDVTYNKFEIELMERLGTFRLAQ